MAWLKSRHLFICAGQGTNSGVRCVARGAVRNAIIIILAMALLLQIATQALALTVPTGASGTYTYGQAPKGWAAYRIDNSASTQTAYAVFVVPTPNTFACILKAWAEDRKNYYPWSTFNKTYGGNVADIYGAVDTASQPSMWYYSYCSNKSNINSTYSYLKDAAVSSSWGQVALKSDWSTYGSGSAWYGASGLPPNIANGQIYKLLKCAFAGNTGTETAQVSAGLVVIPIKAGTYVFYHVSAYQLAPRQITRWKRQVTYDAYGNVTYSNVNLGAGENMINGNEYYNGRLLYVFSTSKPEVKLYIDGALAYDYTSDDEASIWRPLTDTLEATETIPNTVADNYVVQPSYSLPSSLTTSPVPITTLPAGVPTDTASDWSITNVLNSVSNFWATVKGWFNISDVFKRLIDAIIAKGGG